MSDKKNNPGGNFLGIVGFIAGFAFGYNVGENFVLAIIGGIILVLELVFLLETGFGKY